MGLVETEGLILKSYGLAEADKIIVLLTRGEGLIRGVAKGAKRLKSRFGGSLEPFSIVHINYFQKEERELVSIRQIELVTSYFESAGNPLFLQKFAYLVELIIEFAPPHDPNEKLYRMAKVCLETASEHPDSLESIAVYFELWILRLGGFLPDWKICSICKREFSTNQEASLQSGFHLVCRQCRKNRRVFVTGAQRELFMKVQQISPPKFVEYAQNQGKDVREVSGILKRIITGIIGKETSPEKILAANS